MQEQIINNKFYSRLKAVLASGDANALDAISSELDITVLQAGTFPDDSFDGILAIFQDKQFLEFKGSWKLIRVFEQNWNEISEVQRSKLLQAIEISYELFHDWMACFVISGILGEQYKDQRALSVLQKLKRCSKEIPRSFVPHALEHIAKDSVDNELVTLALCELKNMESDSSEIVRKEVHESFLKLGKRRTEGPRN